MDIFNDTSVLPMLRMNKKISKEKESGYLGHDLRYDCETED